MGVLRELGIRVGDESSMFGESMESGEERIFKLERIDGEVSVSLDKTGKRVIVVVEGSYRVWVYDFDYEMQVIGGGTRLFESDLANVLDLHVFEYKKGEGVEDPLLSIGHRKY